MKRIGIIGGLGPEATVDYYKEIIAAFNKINNNGSLNYPDILIYSVNMALFFKMLDKKDYTGAAEYISGKIEQLANAGADFAAISANTPHLFFDEIKRRSPLPMISIVEAASEKAREMGLKKCGLLGTKFTMDAQFIDKVFAKYGIGIATPSEIQKDRINELLFRELELGIFKESTKKELLEIVQEMIDRQSIDSVVLGCTELPIMFSENAYCGIPFLNTTRIHVKAIVE
ncbi:MAG: amino acid racemase, partial [Bacteroidales bacterium]|nr:amino acid racemase [Bacteroidales bacterium]